MQLINVDDSRVIYLFQVQRSAGQLYLPDAAAKVVERYSFVQPPPLQQLTSPSDFIAFRIGKFSDAQINELRVYGDGFIIESKSNTKILDAFLEDLLLLTKKELGLEPLALVTPEKYYESSIIVKSETDITKVMGLPAEVCTNLNKRLANGYISTPFKPSGLVLNCEQQDQGGGKRKAFRFLVERRIGLSFSENIFYSQSPLTTDDHLAFLADLERLAR